MLRTTEYPNIRGLTLQNELHSSDGDSYFGDLKKFSTAAKVRDFKKGSITTPS